jgi:glycosyltransferase involved in cell wall biosynthesis
MNRRPESKAVSRIIHVPRRFALDKWGGTESVVLNLCRQQIARGTVPEIHTSRALSSVEAETWQGIRIQRHRYVYPYFPLRAAERAAYDLKGGNLFSYSLYRALLRARDVRVFHAHTLKRLGGEVLTAARRRGKPCVVTIHGNCFDVPAEEKAALEGNRDRFAIEWGKVLGGLFKSRALLEDADAICCVGHSEYEAACAALPHDRVYYLPNGVNIEPFENANRDEWRAGLGFTPRDFVFGCVSRIDPQKGQKRLLEALREVLRIHPEAAAVIAGPVTDPAYGREVSELALAMGDRVRVLPAVESESAEHAGLLAALDTFVLPSRHEPFGIVVLEAWAAGKPVLASRVGGLVRLIEDGTDGLLSAPGNTADLARQMERLIAESALRENLALAGAAKVRAEFAWSRVYERMETIYQRAESRGGQEGRISLRAAQGT